MLFNYLEGDVHGSGMHEIEVCSIDTDFVTPQLKTLRDIFALMLIFKKRNGEDRKGESLILNTIAAAA